MGAGHRAARVEMLFYVILTILLMEIRTTLHIHYKSTVNKYSWNWDYFSFGSNLCFFAMGLYAYRLTQYAEPSTLPMHWGIPLLITAELGSLVLTEWSAPLKSMGRIDLMPWGIGFAVLCIWQKIHPSYWSANKFLEYVGEISYSTYLLHPILIVLFKVPLKYTYSILLPYVGACAFIIVAMLIIALPLLLSEMTYRLAELPNIKTGQRIKKSTNCITFYNKAEKSWNNGINTNIT